MNKRVLSLLLLSSVCTSLSAAHRDRRHGRKGLKQMEDPTRQIVKVAQDLASTSIQNSDGKNLRQAIVTLK